MGLRLGRDVPGVAAGPPLHSELKQLDGGSTALGYSAEALSMKLKGCGGFELLSAADATDHLGRARSNITPATNQRNDSGLS